MVIVMSISTLNPAGGVPIQLWAPIHEVESGALDQLKNIARLPRVYHHVAVMPDVHLGKGATVGSVVAMEGAVAPGAVGVDIGCGMAAVRTNLTSYWLKGNDLEDLRGDIEAAVPVGFNAHEAGALHNLTPGVRSEAQLLFRYMADLAPGVISEQRAYNQIGTLGGGNHFIELCLADDDSVWLVLHSGSRNAGKTLAEHHMAIAAKLGHNGSLPDKDLATFLSGTPEMAAYRHDLFWAQRYAAVNRDAMLDLCKGVLRKWWGRIDFEEPINCHHNYVAEETHYGQEVLVTRKGAINADAGRLGIIPGSMGTATYIVEGLGNPESFRSASHGAGRRMSRGAAKRAFTVEDLATQTDGVCCRKDQGVVDEIPGAYKEIDAVMANQADLVKVVAKLKQFLCVKG